MTIKEDRLHYDVGMTYFSVTKLVTNLPTIDYWKNKQLRFCTIFVVC